MADLPPVTKGVYVSLKFIAIENHPNDSRVKIREDGICQGLTTRMGTGGGNVPLVLQIDDETDNTDREEIL